jgi:hypothetical protein
MFNFIILFAHMCHQNISQIHKSLIHVDLKEKDHHPSLTSHLVVDLIYVLAMNLHALKWLCSCITWCSIMNGQWLTPMRKLLGLHFPSSKKGFNSNFIKKNPWNQLIRLDSRRLVINNGKGHVKLNVNNHKVCVALCIRCSKYVSR